MLGVVDAVVGSPAKPRKGQVMVVDWVMSFPLAIRFCLDIQASQQYSHTQE